MRLVQLLGDGIEELWEIGDNVTDDTFRNCYVEWIESKEDTIFDEFMEEHYPNIEIERKFVDEIYIEWK